MRLKHIFSDNQGETHIEELHVEFEPSEYPPISVALAGNASRIEVRRLAPGFTSRWHRHLFLAGGGVVMWLEGEVRYETSDGDGMTLSAEGERWALFSKSHGKGHRVRAGDAGAIFVLTYLPSDHPLAK